MPFLRFIPETTNVDFVRWRYAAFAIDGILLLIAVVAIAVRGFNLGIDFRGGVQIEAKSRQTIDIGHVRAMLGIKGFNDISVQYVGGGACNTPADSCILVRARPLAGQPDAAVEAILRAKLTPHFTIRNSEVIGPKVSGELYHDAVIATILAVLMISLYVAFRFEWQYGVGALMATGHDVFVTAGLYALLQLDFSLNSVAALLLLAGYSINDTVVVFDRIRENRRKFKRMQMRELINLSTNQIATRTTLVSMAMALAILPLLLFGGPVLYDFSLAILFGVLVGTFSSTYVAAALLLYLPPIRGGTTDAEPQAARP